MIQKRVVLDTNVCLDLFVFRDPRWSALLAALREGAIEAVTRADCRAEWLAVLEYRHLPLDGNSRAMAIAEFDALIVVPDLPHAGSGAPLPLCSDRDDQKFLELARDAGVGTLITKDKALLKLARRTTRAGLFAIVPPERWQLPAEADVGAPPSASPSSRPSPSPASVPLASRAA